MKPEPSPAASAPTRVMLLSLSTTADGLWHARLVGPDAAPHDFTSPFELARFLSQPPPRAPVDDPRSLK